MTTHPPDLGHGLVRRARVAEFGDPRHDARQLGATWPATAPSSSASSTPSSCEATVLALLSESTVAAQGGYPSGLSPETVMTRYGEQSAVFQAWEQLDGQVLAYQEDYGPVGLLASFVSPAASLCAQHRGAR